MNEIKECQLYLITFYHLGIFWYKPGITTNSQVLEGRFKNEIKNKILVSPKLITSTWFKGKSIAEEYETQLQQEVINIFSGYTAKDGRVRFHNKYLPKQIPGITEIRTYDKEELEFCINFINSIGYKQPKKQPKQQIPNKYSINPSKYFNL